MTKRLNILTDIFSDMPGLHERGIRFIDRTEQNFVSYDQLIKLIQNQAAYFTQQGVKAEHRILISLSNDLEHVVTFLAILYLGAVPVSVKPLFSSQDYYLSYLTRIAKQQAINFYYYRLPAMPEGQVLKYQANSDCFDSLPCYQAKAADIVFVQYTSGSTGSPKPVALSHRAVCHNLHTIGEVDARTASDIGYSFLPLAHDMGLIGGFLSNLVQLNTLLLLDIQYFLRQPIQCLTLAYEHNVCVLPVANFILSYIASVLSKKNAQDLPPLFKTFRTIYVGSEPIRKETIDQFVAVASQYGLQQEALFFCYGLAEATLIASGNRYQNDKSFDDSVTASAIACVGPALGGMEIKVDNADKQVGEILIRGPNVFNGYDNNQDFSQQWFNTGDLGYQLGNNFYIVGRRDDAIVINGRNIYATDIENIMLENFDIKNCFVVFDQSKFYLFIVPKMNIVLSKKDIASQMLEYFGAIPSSIYLLPQNEIPKTTSGKPIKHEMLLNLTHYEQWRLIE